MKQINATKGALEICPNIYKILRAGRLNYWFQYKHLVKSTIEILDFLYNDYEEREKLIFAISPELNLCFIKIKVLILSFEKAESYYTHKKYTLSEVITSLEDESSKIFNNWKDIRPQTIKSYESFVNCKLIKKDKYKVDPYVAQLIGIARKELKKLEPARLKLQQIYEINAKPATYELKLEGETLVIRTSHMGAFILYKNFNWDCNPLRIIRFLMQNPNKRITKSRLIKEQGEITGIDTPLNEQLGKMGFVGLIRKAFTSSSKNTAVVRNLLKIDDLINLGISPKELDLTIQMLTPVKS